MQLKKWHWKRVRNESPCIECGGEHPSSTCLMRHGGKRFSFQRDQEAEALEKKGRGRK